MKTLILTLTILLACSSALAADPMALSTSADGTMTIVTNVSGRDIRAFFVTIVTDGDKALVENRHDHFFGSTVPPEGLAPIPDGGTAHIEYVGDTQVRWVEFTDGTAWGDPVYGAKVLQMRKDMLFLYQSLAATTTDADFQSTLVRVRGDNDMARNEVQGYINNSGIAFARAKVGKRLANASLQVVK